MTSKYQSGEPWKAEHDVALIKSVVHLVMSNRSTLYADPSLASVNNNGGDRINKKTQQLLKKLTDGVPGGEGIIKEAISATRAGKGNGARTSPAKGKGKKGSGTSPQTSPKKRKVKREGSDEEEKPELESEGE